MIYYICVWRLPVDMMGTAETHQLSDAHEQLPQPGYESKFLTLPMKKTRPTCWHKTCSRLNSSLGILKTVINDWQQYLIILRTSKEWFGQGHVRAENLDFDSVTSSHTINLYGERERDDPTLPWGTR